MRLTLDVGQGRPRTVDTRTTEHDIDRAEPLFFKTKHGLRESYEIRRGFVIVSTTPRRVGAWNPSRRHVVYSFDPTDGYTLHVDHWPTLAGARAAIDSFPEVSPAPTAEGTS